MATITKGYTFGATELVTNTKLHTLVDSATLTSVAISEILPAVANFVWWEGNLIAWENELVYLG
jgi:glucose-6-phosphate dehydrogenase assembly protein OpcA